MTYSNSAVGPNKDYGSLRANERRLFAKEAKRRQEKAGSTWTLKRPEWSKVDVSFGDQLVRGMAAAFGIPLGVISPEAALMSRAALWMIPSGDVQNPTREEKPEPWAPTFIDEQIKRTGRWYLRPSEHMRQGDLVFPRVAESMLYRVEHRTRPVYAEGRHPFGAGPYGNAGILEDLPYTKYKNGVDTTPAPRDDPKLQQALFEGTGDHLPHHLCFFGFQSPQALLRWFDSPRFHRACDRHGWVVRRYLGTVYHGGFQSVIDARFPVRRIDTVSVW